MFGLIESNESEIRLLCHYCLIYLTMRLNLLHESKMFVAYYVTRSRSSRPGFRLFEYYRQKIEFLKHNSVLARIQNVQDIIRLFISKISDIIRKESRRQVKIYLQRVFLLPPSPVLANIHSIHTCDVPHTEDVGLPTKFRFNVGPASQPIAGLMPINRLRRWPNTNLSLGLLYNLRKHVAFTQCCCNVDPQSSTLARH